MRELEELDRFTGSRPPRRDPSLEGPTPGAAGSIGTHSAQALLNVQRTAGNRAAAAMVAAAAPVPVQRIEEDEEETEEEEADAPAQPSRMARFARALPKPVRKGVGYGILGGYRAYRGAVNAKNWVTGIPGRRRKAANREEWRDKQTELDEAKSAGAPAQDIAALEAELEELEDRGTGVRGMVNI